MFLLARRLELAILQGAEMYLLGNLLAARTTEATMSSLVTKQARLLLGQACSLLIIQAHLPLYCMAIFLLNS